MVARNRGQLILIGAIALAFIILGLVVVLNGVLFTETIASGNDVEEVGNAERSDLEVRRGVGGLVREVNVGANESTDEDDLEDAIEANVSSFQRNYSNVTSGSQAQLTNVSGVNVSEYGRLVHQPDQAPLTNNSSASGDPHWNVYNNSGSERLEAFVLTVNNSTLSGAGVVIEVENSSDTNSITISQGSDGNVSVDDATNTSCEIETRSDGTVEIDLLRGQLRGGGEHDCNTLRLPPDPDDVKRLGFENGDQGEGTYEIVFEAETPDSSNDRWSVLAATTVEVDYHFQGEGVSYDRTLEVDVYGGAA